MLSYTMPASVEVERCPTAGGAPSSRARTVTRSALGVELISPSVRCVNLVSDLPLLIVRSGRSLREGQRKRPHRSARPSSKSKRRGLLLVLVLLDRVDVDRRLGKRRQQLVCLAFFVERLLKEVGLRLVAEETGVGANAAV